jgi:hypothetical protein
MIIDTNKYPKNWTIGKIERNTLIFHKYNAYMLGGNTRKMDVYTWLADDFNLCTLQIIKIIKSCEKLQS